MCAYLSSRIWDGGDIVGEAVAMIAGMMAASDRGGYRDRRSAISSIARSARIPPSTIRALVQPSRRPKVIRVDVWLRLRGAYLAFCRAEASRLAAEISRIEVLGSDDAAVQNLVAEAKDLEDRIAALL